MSACADIRDTAVEVLNSVNQLVYDTETWGSRDLGRGATADEIRASQSAIGAVDASLRDLHHLRAQLVSERRSDADACMERTAAMLARAGWPTGSAREES